jgi:transposase
MSASLLYHAFGVRGYSLKKTEFKAGGTIFHVERRRKDYRCPVCGSPNVAGRGKVARQFRLPPIGRKKAFVSLPVPRVECRECGTLRQIELGFADPRVSYTKAFAQYALDLSRITTIQDVAEHLGTSWDLIKGIVKEDLAKRFKRPYLGDVRRIAVDEIYAGKKRGYLTIVLDLESGAIVHVGKGKGSEALTPFWRRLRRSGASIEAVAADMSPAYMEAVLMNLPDAALVFDRFHVMKLFNDKLSDLRRELYRTTTDAMAKSVLKGSRWLLLKREGNLEPEKNERERLLEALRLNEPLALAYYMKEELAEFWNQGDAKTAERFLDDWIARAEASGVRTLIQFARTLRLHAFGLLAWYDYPISTGPLEGVNNKIKTMTRQAYGFRDQEFFRLKLFALHQAKYALVG